MADDNPFLDMGLLQMMQPNPFIDDAYKGKLSLPGFRGTATNYAGQPIGAPPPPPQGTTTLNTPGPQAAPFNGTPAVPGQPYQVGSDFGSAAGPVNELLSNYAAAQSKLTPQQQLIQSQNAAIRNRNLANLNTMNIGRASQGGFGNPNSAGDIINAGRLEIPPVPSVASAAPANGAPAPTGFDARQDYLDKLANPGNPPIVGANVPASSPLGVPSVLSAFLAAHPSGGAKGAGNYNNSGFFDTLNQLGKVG
jgi:hypothetical protein